MPTFKDEDGNEVEAVPIEEVEEQISQAKEEAKAEAEEAFNTAKEEHESELEELQSRIDEKEKELEKAGDKNVNFKKLRESKEALEKEKQDIEKKFNEKIEEVITPLKEEIKSSKISSEIERLANGDKALEEKIKFHFDSFKGEPENDEQRAERLKNAHILATGGEKKPNISSSPGAGTGGGLPGGFSPAGDKKLTGKQKEIGSKMFNLSKKDMDNYEKS